MQAELRKAALAIQASRKLLVLTGAGLSREAGLPTFRDAQGLWRKHRPEDLASPEAFARNPALVWEWYRLRMEAARAAMPHAGHQALAALALRKGERMLVLNQNVDGLLERAYGDSGAPGHRLLALHGRLDRAHCQRCGNGCAAEQIGAEAVPLCPCGGRLRPSVVWFGESLSALHVECMDSWARQADLLLAVGTSAVVWPAAGLLPMARRRSVPVVVVNPRPEGVESGDLWIAEGAMRALPALVEEA